MGTVSKQRAGGGTCASLKCDRVVGAAAAAAAAAACGSVRLAEAAPRLPEARCLEPGVSSAALACCRFPSQLLLSPPTGSRNARHASTAGPGFRGGVKPRPAAAVSRPRLREGSWLGRPFHGRTVSSPVVFSDRAWKWLAPFGRGFFSSSADLLLNIAAGAVGRPADVAVGCACRCA